MRNSTDGIIKTLRRAGVHAGVNALYFSGLGTLPKAYARFQDAKHHRAGRVWPFAVLLYHRVNDTADPYFPGVGMKVFAAQMSYLAKNCNVISLTRLLDQVDEGIGVQPRTVAVTFDDGYRDNYLYAHPILKELGIPASVFVATGYTDTSRSMWNDRIAGAIKGTTRRAMKLELPGETLCLRLDADCSKLASLMSTLEKLKSLPDAEKNPIVDDVVQQLGGMSAVSNRLMLSWTELREMARSGWEVGSHTVEHRILTRISAAELHEEVTNSKTTLEQQLQMPVTLFAYPNGKQQDFGETVKESVQSAGYRAALTTLSGLNTEGFEPFEISRISPWEEPLALFAVKLEWMFWKSTTELRGALSK